MTSFRAWRWWVVSMAGIGVACGGQVAAGVSAPPDAASIDPPAAEDDAGAATPPTPARPTRPDPCDSPGGVSASSTCVWNIGPRSANSYTCDAGLCTLTGNNQPQCIPFSGEGEPCYPMPRAFACAKGLHCNEPTQRCVKPAAAGEWCRHGDCADGLYCDGSVPDPEAPFGNVIICRNQGHCTPAGTKGAPCKAAWECAKSTASRDACRAGTCE